MTHIFEEYNFKSYLHKNCKKAWFYSGKYIVQYRDQGGDHPANTTERHTVAVSWPIEDPILNKKGLGTASAVSATASGTSALLAGTILTAPLTGGASLAIAAGSLLNAGAAGTIAVGLFSEKDTPEDVYFSLNNLSGGSEWVAKNVPVNGAWQVATNVCSWSNQVFQERYVNQQSSQFQAYIQERPPTPY